MIKSVKFRVKDKNKCEILSQMARDTNFVWNVLNSASRKKWKESRKLFHKFDPWFNAIINGASKELSINSETIQGIRDQFHKDIRQQKKQLRFRGKKSPKWIPFKSRTISIKNDSVVYDKKIFRFWKSMNINGSVKSGCFTQETNGKWFIVFNYEYIENIKPSGQNNVGIDLGLKDVAVCSDGKKLNIDELKIIDSKIRKQQRARNFKAVKNLHVKKKNVKNDKFNKFALDLVKTNNLIAIGNISGFTKGKMAKSRYQSSWSLLKGKIKNKCLEYDSKLVEVSEYLTTQTCNICGSIEGPKGIKELSVRNWICGCGAELNRDINASINILFRAKCLAS